MNISADHFSRTWERIANGTRIASLSLVPDESGNVQQMQLQFNDLETRDQIPSAQFYGYASSPLVGAKAIVFSPAGDTGGGVVLNTHDPRYRPTGMAAGEVMLYDNQGQKVYVAGDGSIRISAGHKVVVTCDTEMDVTAPTVNVNASSQVNINSTAVTINAPNITLIGTVEVTGVLKENGIVVIAP